jgi:secreted PhoX family phosphatase
MALQGGISTRIALRARGFACALALGLVSAPVLAQGVAPGALDFGSLVEEVLRVRSRVLFGVSEPLDSPATPADAVPRAQASAAQRILLAAGLDASFVTRRVASRADMMVLWPDPLDPTHLLLCIEQPRQGVTPGGHGGLNTSVQRVDLASGEVTTVLHGLRNCDGIRRTPWGTVLVTEEAADGRAYEILDPLDVTGHWVANRGTGDVRSAIDGLEPSRKVAQRPALPTFAWEGLAVSEEGVVFAVDELRPGTGAPDRDGGALYKFVPDFPRTSIAPLDDLAASPLAAGSVYAFSVSCFEPSHPSFPQFGQGCETGVGAWVRVGAATARADARDRGATGTYRPEDLHRDPLYDGPGIRLCWALTGRGPASDYGSVLCAVDPAPVPQMPAEWFDPRTGFSYLADGGEPATAVVHRFVEGDPRFHSLDNLAFQPGTGHLFVTEDDRFGEIWACLRDGADRDPHTDGCIPVASVTDPGAEPTGFTFDGTGRTAFVVVQHGENSPETLDFGSNPVDGRTDDLIRISGFEAPAGVELRPRRTAP